MAELNNEERNEERILSLFKNRANKLFEYVNSDLLALSHIIEQIISIDDAETILNEDTSIGKLYKYIIQNPYFVIIEEIDQYGNMVVNVKASLIYNLVLRYYILQVGAINRSYKDKFTIKGGFTIQLMLNGQYPTDDIDLKIHTPLDAKYIYKELLKLKPQIPEALRIERIERMEITSRKESEKSLYKFTFICGTIRKAFMDLDYSAVPNNIRPIFKKSGTNTIKTIKTEYRLARLNDDRFELLYPIYSFETQREEKEYLIKKYNNIVKLCIEQHIDEILTILNHGFENVIIVERPEIKKNIYFLLYYYFLADGDNFDRILNTILIRKDFYITDFNKNFNFLINKMFEVRTTDNRAAENTPNTTIKISFSNCFFYIKKFDKAFKALGSNQSILWKTRTNEMIKAYYGKNPEDIEFKKRYNKIQSKKMNEKKKLNNKTKQKRARLQKHYRDITGEEPTYITNNNAENNDENKSPKINSFFSARDEPFNIFQNTIEPENVSIHKNNNTTKNTKPIKPTKTTKNNKKTKK